MNHLDTVQQVYESFGKGDIPAIVDRLDENVTWITRSEVPGVPWATAAPWQGEYPGHLSRAWRRFTLPGSNRIPSWPTATRCSR